MFLAMEDLLNSINVQTAIVAVVTLILVYILTSRNRRMPAGPIGFPILGYLPFLTTKPYLKLQELQKKYGPVYSIRIGSTDILVLGDHESIKEAFQKDVFMGRPKRSIFPLSKENIATGAFNGVAWKEQRKFSVHMLRDLGLGKTKMEEHISEEIREMVERIGNDCSKPLIFKKYLTPSISNNICSVVFGKRRRFDDPKRIMLDNMLSEFPPLVAKTAWMIFFPWIFDLAHFMNIGVLQNMRRVTRKVDDYMRDELVEHSKSLDSNNIRDFVDAYLLEMEKKKDDTSSTFKEPILRDLVRGLFGAGSETVRVTVDWLLLVSVAFPEVQQRVYEEIKEVIGTERFPTRSDHKNMPYTESVIMEIMRWKTIIPLNILRSTLEDTYYRSFFIPKNTYVLANLWAAQHDKEVWGEDADEFKPERFLSEDAKTFKKPEYYIPFSIGKRACPGEALATVEVFLYYTAILQKFQLTLPDGKVADLDGYMGISLTPKPQELCVKPR